MILRNVLFFFLVVIGLFAKGNSKEISLDPDNKRVTANFDKIFDQLLPKIQTAIKENGLDPMELRSFSEKVVPLPGRLKGNINFRNGFLHYTSELRRAKHVTAQYSHKRLLLDMTLGWRILDFSYEYDFTYLLLKRRGDVYGRFEDADFNVIIEVDFSNYKVMLHRLRSLRVGEFSLKLYGNKMDPLLNTIVRAVTHIFQDRVIKMIEDKSLMIFEPLIDSINKLIKKPKHENSNLTNVYH